MADIERTLVSKVIQTGELPDVMARGIKVDHFADAECQEVWDWAMHFHRRHGQAPSPAVLREEFPDFGMVVNRDPVSYHLERFIKKVKERTAIDLVREYHTIIEDPDMIDDIEIHALTMARQLAEILPAPRASRFSDKQRVGEYERRQQEGILHGILFGIPAIDSVLLGIQPHEMLTIAAYMGVGKSILMAYIAYMAYLQRKTSLFVSLEMESEAVLRRIDVMASNVRYQALKALELDSGEKEQWEKILERAHEDRHERDIIIRDDIRDCTADMVWAETMRYKPDLVCVDYLELMSVPRSHGNGTQQGWEKVSSAGMALKQNARVMKIPIITAAQVNRDGGRDKVTLANVGHQSIGKHSDIMLGLSQDEEQETQGEMDVISLKVRDGKKPRTTMRWALDTMDIRQKGVEDRFPDRKGGGKKTTTRAERQRQQLGIKRTAGDKTNPFSERAGKKAKPRQRTVVNRKTKPKVRSFKDKVAV
jgi:hypothetical protein